MTLTKILILILICCAAVVGAAAQQRREELKIPDGLKPFVEKNTKAIAVESADLNADGAADYILVLETLHGEAEEFVSRSALIIAQDRAGKLSVAARNEAVVFAPVCADGCAEFFRGITINKNGSFTVENLSGSFLNETYEFTFKYSRRDKTWLLSRAVEADYDIYTDKTKRRVYTEPKHFGKIRFADFDPENYLKKR